MGQAAIVSRAHTPDAKGPHRLFRSSRLEQPLAAEVGKDVGRELQNDRADLLVDEVAVLLCRILQDMLLEVARADSAAMVR